MTHALSDIDLIRDAWSRRPFGLLCDLDGTLSPLAASPSEARVTPANLRLLGELARRCLVAIVTGRDLPDLKAIVPIQGLVLVGLHGAAWNLEGHDELAPEAEPYRELTGRATTELAGLHRIDGVFVERKTAGIAIHYRAAADPNAARAAILSAIAGSPAAMQFEQHEGILLVELRLPLGITKGTAARQLQARFGLQGLLYVGDDRTDMDAFAAVQAMRQQGAATGYALAAVHQESVPAVAAAADFTVAGVAGVEQLLEALLHHLEE